LKGIEMDITRRMMKALRGRRDLEYNDSSQDEKILKMTPVQIVRECVAWELGDPSWADQIAHWMVAARARPQDF
jgi:hypothetical protein